MARGRKKAEALPEQPKASRGDALAPKEVEAISNAIVGSSAEEVLKDASAVADVIKQGKEINESGDQLFKGGALGVYEIEQEASDGQKRKVEIRILRGRSSRDEKVILLGQLVGVDLVQRCKVIARGRNVHVLDMLIPGLSFAFEEGVFEAEGAKEPRVGLDEADESPANVLLQEVLGKELFIRIKDHARGRFVANVEALKCGLQHCIDAATI